SSPGTEPARAAARLGPGRPRRTTRARAPGERRRELAGSGEPHRAARRRDASLSRLRRAIVAGREGGRRGEAGRRESKIVHVSPGPDRAVRRGNGREALHMRFEGKVAIVTGAAKGIGLRVARAFGHEGARVAALDVNADGVESLAHELGAAGREAVGLKVDVTAAGEVRRAVEAVVSRWGRVDVLVNNAGGFSVIRRTEDIPDEEWEAIFRFNVT